MMTVPAYVPPSEWELIVPRLSQIPFAMAATVSSSLDAPTGSRC